MYRYPGNYMDSEMVTVPRQLKTRPGAPQTHLAYITGDEANLLKEYKPNTPHEGAAGIPNYDTWGIDTTTGAVTGGSTADTGGSWSGDVSYGNQGNQDNQDNQGNQGNIHQGETVIPTDTIINTDVTDTVTPLTEEEKIWNLATQAYESNPGYALSYQGKEYAKLLAKHGIIKGTPEYQDEMIKAFGMPKVASNYKQYAGVDPMDPKYQKSFKGKELMAAGVMPGSAEWDAAFRPELQLSGQGQHLMGQYDQPGTYQEKIDDYYTMREEEMAQQTGGDQGYGYGYGHGSGGGGGGGYPMGGYAPAHRQHQAFLDQLYKGRLAGGQEVQKMLAMDQKIEAANVLSGLSQGAQAFAMDPKARGIMAVLTA